MKAKKVPETAQGTRAAQIAGALGMSRQEGERLQIAQVEKPEKYRPAGAEGSAVN